MDLRKPKKKLPPGSPLTLCMMTPIVLPRTQEALEIEERHIEARHSRTGVSTEQRLVRLEQQNEERI
jgi:hypothetical protein